MEDSSTSESIHVINDLLNMIVDGNWAYISLLDFFYFRLCNSALVWMFLLVLCEDKDLPRMAPLFLFSSQTA